MSLLPCSFLVEAYYIFVNWIEGIKIILSVHPELIKDMGEIKVRVFFYNSKLNLCLEFFEDMSEGWTY